MRFTLTLEDADGNQICMTDPASTGIMTSEIEGLSPPAGTLSTAGYAGSDGSYLTNAYVDKRNIVISFQIRGASSTIEERRQNLYDIVQPGQYIKVNYKTTRRNVYAEGYVESVTVSNFSAETGGQISILCPDIYWHAVDDALPDMAITAISKDWQTTSQNIVVQVYYMIAGYAKSTDAATDVKSYVLKVYNKSSMDVTVESLVWYQGADSEPSYYGNGSVYPKYGFLEAFSFPAGGWIEINSATELKYARVYDSGGSCIAVLPQGFDVGVLKVISANIPYHQFYFIVAAGISTDDEITDFSDGIVIEVTPYTTYLGV